MTGEWKMRGGGKSVGTTASTTGQLRQRLAVLNTAGRAIARSGDQAELLRALHQELSSVLDTTMLILGLYDEASRTIEVVGQIVAGKELPGGTIPLGEGFASHAIRTGKSELIRHWSQCGPRVHVQYATDRPGLPESGLTVPLISNERVVGVLLVQSYEADAYDEDDLLLVEAVATHVATAIEMMHRSASLNDQLLQRVGELEAILAAMADALLIVDDAGRIVRLNNAARNLLCLDNARIVLGQPLSEERSGRWPLGAREVAEELAPIVEALGRGETLPDHDVEFRTGGRRVLSFSCAPLLRPGGDPAGGVVVFRDVTERRAVQRLKDEILSIASHDLRTPLTAIKGRAQLLQRRLASGRATPSEIEEGLSTVTRQVDRVIDLLALLLDLSRLEAGRLDLHRSRIDLIALVSGVIDSVQATADRHHLVLRGPEYVEGNWDERRLEQVLRNLLTNAVKYSPGGGIVELTVEADTAGVIVRVRDEGVGLSDDELAHVFERFYRAEGTRRLEGTGLGLYICQGIIAAHGGHIWAESAGRGHGTQISFRLPY